ncbi:MAG: hypothetical protein HC829_02145 [Bacteroidales bacterium]|nr:hypothetical protein [Bacteroidales bacterium]
MTKSHYSSPGNVRGNMVAVETPDGPVPLVVPTAPPVIVLRTNASDSGAWIKIDAGTYYWNVWGTFANGERVRLLWSPDGGTTAFDSFDGPLTRVALPAKTKISLDEGWVRVTLDVGAGSSINSTLGMLV